MRRPHIFPAKSKNCLVLATVALGVLVGAATGPGAAAETTTLTARYLITLAGLTIGKADAEARFTPSAYAAAITGSTFGITRFVSNAEAILIGSGSLDRNEVIPATYSLETREQNFDTEVHMSMSGGAITDLLAMPRLIDAPDRVPVTAKDISQVVDPVGAFIVVRDWRGPVNNRRACNRTVRVFDGWQRFDVALTFKEHAYVKADSADSYGGEVTVCAARYVPVAGHRPSREQVQYMAQNKRLEVWLAPVKKSRVLIPFKVIIGTKIGDLMINAQSFVAESTEHRASAE